MNQVAVILALVLASTNASKYLQPLRQYQQEPLTRQTADDALYINDGYDEESFGFLPKLTSDLNQLEGWASATDPRSFIFADLQPNRLSKPDELRIKRKEASLSIVNALDVLREQLMLEFARRKMNESKAQIQKNLELLRKAGKRSHKNLDDPVNYGMQEYLLRKRTQGDDLGKGLPVISSKSSEEKSTTRRNQNEPAYQT